MLAEAPVRDPSPPQAEGPNAAVSPTQMDLTASGPSMQAPPPPPPTLRLLTNGWCITVGTSFQINPNKGLACLGADIQTLGERRVEFFSFVCFVLWDAGMSFLCQ
ncbi:hypothetical protein PBY51_021890 [Eleginops maclovinus]|uniref:Uncharacterized protein n=1 Tax=Eleginops maclovinus TaxID=56733 RepID=A0AAN8AF35_ELEMC|nr:hypothetical protein PBY51_021890 [Eleginops maclovinus]